MRKKLWEVWDYRGPKPQMVAVVRGRKEAVNKAKILAPSALHWTRTHKVYRADK
jgi:hypothetical protein